MIWQDRLNFSVRNLDRGPLFLLLRKLSATAAQAEGEMDAFLSAMEAMLTQKDCSLSGGKPLAVPGVGE